MDTNGSKRYNKTFRRIQKVGKNFLNRTQKAVPIKKKWANWFTLK